MNSLGLKFVHPFLLLLTVLEISTWDVRTCTDPTPKLMSCKDFFCRLSLGAFTVCVFITADWTCGTQNPKTNAPSHYSTNYTTMKPPCWGLTNNVGPLCRRTVDRVLLRKGWPGPFASEGQLVLGCFWGRAHGDVSGNRQRLRTHCQQRDK